MFIIFVANIFNKKVRW